MTSTSSSSSSSAYEQEQQLFTDTLLKLQVHSALAKESVYNNKSPLPFLAQSCSLLDNIPAHSLQWTTVQENLISSLRIDAWKVLADACIKANDLIQAEASLERLATLQEVAAGPLSLRSKARNRRRGRPSVSETPNSISVSDSSTSSAPSASLPSTTSVVVQATKEERQAATDLILTWEKLYQVYRDMGRQDMANNFVKRAEKMNEHLRGI
ncbi:hypothetical protein BC939DRAFT_437860 [Gamsiella multidivaricata]|uniref:uncharacterized protein n=1 Tax=Gamsiella multidivaricata TaxID=101098 RepID=UPI002220180D|nr:uncharacterized protein BC939DRAFT_437860 [Gamsiella multidivaricata]KAI7831185.1 hypothetical protein BC939DRAFT_437860 [Gamsiella multidivaricata]